MLKKLINIMENLKRVQYFQIKKYLNKVYSIIKIHKKQRHSIE